MPPAPPIFSITTGWPSSSPIRCANNRASTSLGPPAANGLIMVMGRVGHCWASTWVAKLNEAAASSAVNIRDIVFSKVSFWPLLPLARLDQLILHT
jgi:hypothetical protein